jgi:hypothetical protein
MKVKMVISLLSANMMVTCGGFAAAADTTTLNLLQQELAREKVIQQREAMQATRIQNGVQSGKLNDAEKVRLQNQLNEIKQNFQQMMTNTTPGLDRQEFSRLQAELNRNSAAIYRLKHNHEKLVKP